MFEDKFSESEGSIEDKKWKTGRAEKVSEEGLIDLDTAFKQMGGFGRFQWLATFSLCLSRNSGNYLYYCFAYLTLEQMFECKAVDGQFEACTASEQICPARALGTDLEFRVDNSYEYHLQNWYLEMDLLCQSKVKTSFLVSARYIACGVAGFFFFALPERYGRKKTMLCSLMPSLVSQYVIVFSVNYWARLGGFILFGICQLKSGISFVWLGELVPKRNNVHVSAAISSFDASTLGVACFYFLFISRDWFPLILAMTVLGTAAFLINAFVLPESPTWLLNKGRT